MFYILFDTRSLGFIFTLLLLSSCNCLLDHIYLYQIYVCLFSPLRPFFGSSLPHICAALAYSSSERGRLLQVNCF
jgi:hypothetical protein